MDFLTALKPSLFKPAHLSEQSQRHMARRNTWSAKQGPIKEVPDDEDYISANDIRKSIVLSMAADDEDWSNYRRRSSGGSAVQVFQQNRSRRSSREDTQQSSMEIQRRQKTADRNGNYAAVNLATQIERSEDTSCEDLLKYVKEKIEKLEMETNTDERKRRFGQVSRKPNLTLPNGGYPSTKDRLSRLSSDPGYGTNTKVNTLSRLRVPNMMQKCNSEDSPLSPEVYDISGQTSDNRFPWLKDQGVQCNMSPAEPKPRPFSEMYAPTQPVQKERADRSLSYSSIYGNNRHTFRQHLRQRSADEAMEFHDGKVVLDPEVLKESLEFYAERARAEAENMEMEGDPIKAYKGGRRSCVVSALELGDSEAQSVDESSETQTYPGDLVLVNGQALRHPSPPTLNGDADHYGSEGSLAMDPSPSSNSPTLPKEKPLKQKKSFFTVVQRKGKKSMPDLEYVLSHMKTTEFRDERLVSIRHMHWTDFVAGHGEITTDILDKEKSRRNAAWEIFTNECNFLVDRLMVLKHCFMEPLKKCQVEGLLMEVEPSKLFGNLDELCDLSFRFCRDFHAALRSTMSSDFASTECICNSLDTMTLNSQDGDIYHSYLLNYRSALTYLDILRNTLEDYTIFEKICEQDSRCNKLRLADLLVAPMQHWTRLPLLLQNVRKYTASEWEVERLDESNNRVVSSLKSLENKMEWLKTFERVKEIEKQLIWPTVSEIDSKAFIPEALKGVLSMQRTENLLDDRIREITFEGPLVLVEKDNKNVDTHVFLFTDFLLFTKMKKDTKRARGRMSTIDKNEGFYHVLKQPIPVQSLSIHDIGSAEAGLNGMKNMFVLVQRNTFQQVVGVFTLQAHTSLGKENWLAHLRDNKEKTMEVNNNKSELASRQRSFRDNHDTGSHTNLLKNSQVLEITHSTSATLPRRSQTCSHKMGLSLPMNKPLSDEDVSNIKQNMMFDKSRTFSTGCISSESLLPHINGNYVH